MLVFVEAALSEANRPTSYSSSVRGYRRLSFVNPEHEVMTPYAPYDPYASTPSRRRRNPGRPGHQLWARHRARGFVLNAQGAREMVAATYSGQPVIEAEGSRA